MYAANYIIDSVQNAKLVFFRKIIKDQELQKMAEDCVKAQSDFAKSMINTSLDLAQYSFEKMTKPFFPKSSGAEAPKK